MKEKIQHKELEKEKVDWIALFKFIWAKRIVVALSITFFILLGLFVALNTSEQYTSTATFISQSNSSSRSGNLSNLASMAGINLNLPINNTEIPIGLYPRVGRSTIFKKELLNIPINISGIEETITYREYYENYYKPANMVYVKKYTVGLPKVLINLVRKNEVRSDSSDIPSVVASGPIKISDLEFEHFLRLESQMEIKPNENDGYIEVGFSMPDPVASAQMAQAVLDLLQKKIIDYRINTAKEQLEFAESRFAEKKKEFNAIQSRLSTYRDRNLNITSSVARSELEKIEAEYNLVLGVYNDLARQLESSRLQVKRDTPIFSIIDPVSIPLQRSKPNKPLIMVVFVLLGGIFATGYISLSYFWKDLKVRWIDAEVREN